MQSNAPAMLLIVRLHKDGRASIVLESCIVRKTVALKMMKKDSPERVPEEYYTTDEYLSFERQSVDAKHEYLDGEIVAMAGASRAHNLITGNIAQRLRNQLGGTTCETYTSDMRVKTSPTRYTYPDVVVVCQTPELEDEHLDTLLNPTVIVEVLSPSTTARDRNQKFSEYRALPSVRDYLVVSQDRMLVEHYSRQPNNDWTLHEVVSPDEAIPITSIGCELSLSDVYERVEFPS